MRDWAFRLTASGLLLDIIGAGVLVWDLLFMTEEKANSFSTKGIRSPGHQMQKLDRLNQSRHAKLGLICLVLGFVGQLVGASLSYFA